MGAVYAFGGVRIKQPTKICCLYPAQVFPFRGRWDIFCFLHLPPIDNWSIYIYILCILLHSRDSLCPHTVIYMFLVAAQPYGLNVIILSFRITGCISTLPFRKAAAIAGTSSPSASLFRSSLVLTLLTVIISTAAMCGSKAMNSRGQYMTTLA